MLLASPLARLLFDGRPDEVRAIRAAAVAVPLTAMSNVLQHWYRMVRRPGPALAVAAAGSAGIVVATLVAVLVGDGGVAAVFGAQAAAGAVITPIGLVALRRAASRPSVDRVRLAAMARYALPLLPALAAPLLLGLIARGLIGALAGVEAVGEYQIVTMLATVTVLLTQTMQQTWEPFALSITDREAARPLYRQAFGGYVVLAAWFAVAITAVLPAVLAVLGRGFDDLALATVVFSASILVTGLFPVVNTGPAIAGTGRPAFEAIALGLVGNVGLTALLVPHVGQIGACWAALATGALLIGGRVAARRSGLARRLPAPLHARHRRGDDGRRHRAGPARPRRTRARRPGRRQCGARGGRDRVAVRQLLSLRRTDGGGAAAPAP